MRGIMDMKGKKFNFLTVIEYAGKNSRNELLWRCRCDCGRETVLAGIKIRSGQPKSCGCFAGGKGVPKKHTNCTHGQTSKKYNGGMSRTYKSWAAMKNRCLNPKTPRYKDYGGRGIKIYEPWKRFENFYSDMGERGTGMTLERIDSNGDYTPENCKWADNKTQARNKRTNHYLTYRGETKSMAEWAEIYGMNYSLLRSRINTLHWNVEKALTTPSRKNKIADRI